MQMIQDGYRGLSLLVKLNMDWVLHFGALSLALLAATYLGSLTL